MLPLGLKLPVLNEKADLNPVMLLKGNILRQFEIFYKDLYGKPLKRN